MYIKFLAHGQGDPAKAASYLIDEVDHLNRPRADVQVLRGDPHTFTAIAEAIQNKWKYTSGVIAWSKDDAPTNEEINEVLDSFEKHAFAGLDPHQFHLTAVLHEEADGSKHVHFLVPRIELESGKALNIAPPGHEKYFDSLRDYFNYSKGWSRPDDPNLKRDTQLPDYIHFQDKSAVRAGLKGKPASSVREVVGSYIEQRVEHGFIRDRKDVLGAVSELGTITRFSDQSISLKLDGAKKAVKLKGAFYESGFNIKSYFEDRARKANDARASGEHQVVSPEHRQLAEQCRKKSEKLAIKRATYNGERYQSDGRSQVEPSFSSNREPEFSPIVTTTNERDSYSFEPTSTATQATASKVGRVVQHKPTGSSNRQDQEEFINVQYRDGIGSSDLNHKQLSFWLREQKPLQRNAASQSIAAGRTAEASRGQSGFDFKQEGAKQEVPPNRLQGLDPNDDRKTTFEDHSRATAAARSRLEAIGTTGFDDFRFRRLQQQIIDVQQQITGEEQGARRSNQEATDSSVFRAAVDGVGNRLKTAVAEALDSVSGQFRDRESSSSISKKFAERSASRNRNTVEAIDCTSSGKNGFSRSLSAKTSKFDRDVILQALAELKRRNECEQVRKNDQGNTPSPW